jgi:hypothetical protein
MCLTQVYEIDCDVLICGPLLCGPAKSGRLDAVLPTRPVHRDFRRYGRPPEARAWTVGADGPGYPAESMAVSSRFHCRAWPVTPSCYPAPPWACPSFRASAQVSAIATGRSRPATSAPGRSHVPVRPGAAWCSGWGTDLTWQDRTRPPSPRRPGQRGMRNGNVPRRSTHPLEVFPCVQ